MANPIKINSVHDRVSGRSFWLTIDLSDHKRVAVLYNNGDYHSGDPALADQARAELQSVYERHANAANQPHSAPDPAIQPWTGAADDDQCEGHYDDDATLTSGVGIGEPTYCDGSCQS